MATILAFGIAVGSAGTAMADDATHTLKGAATWDISTTNGMDNTVGSGNDVVMSSHTLIIDGAASESTVGALTATTGNLIIETLTDAANTKTIGSIAISGAGNITVRVTDQTDRSVAATVTGNVSTGGNLIMTHIEPGGLTTNLLSVGGTLAVTGTTGITGGNGGNADTTTLTVTGNATLTGVVTLTSTTAATASATLNLNGVTNAATAGIVMNDSTGLSKLNFTNTATATMSGTIAGGGDGQGTVSILGGANKVTLADTVGTSSTSLLALNVGSATLAGNAAFTSAVDAVTITVYTQVAADAVADFNAAVVATNIAITGGNATNELATAKFFGAVTGIITLDEGTNGTATATFDGTSAQTVTGNVVAQGDGEGVITVSNSNGVTFVDNFGVAAAGLDSVQISSGATLTHKAGVTNAQTFDVVGNITADGSSGTGGTLVIEGGDSTGSDAVGGAITLATITGNTILTTLTVQGGDGSENDVGGAVTQTIFTGTATVTTYNVIGGAGSTDTGNTGGAGGAVATHLQTGATAATNVNLTGGAGGQGNDTAAQIGGAGGAVGSGSNTFTGLVTATVNMTGGAGGTGGSGATATGGVGGIGGAVTVTDLAGGVTGSVVLTGGAGGTGGLGHDNVGGIGGAGGLVTLTTMDAAGTLAAVTVTGGTGGTGGASGVSVGGVGGAGGTIVITDIDDGLTGNLTVTAGSGGTGGAGTGAAVGGIGGIGTDIASTTISGAITGNVSLTSGSGGTGGAGAAGIGGVGGAGADVAMTLEGNIGGTITLDDGAAGSSGAAGTAAGGAGGAASTVTLTLDTLTVTGNVIAASDGEGAIASASGLVTFSGEIGTSSSALRLLTATTAMTFTKNVYADSLVAGSSAVIFAGTSEQIVSGAITGDADMTINASSSATFKSTSTMDTLTIAATSSTLKLYDGLTIQNSDGLTLSAKGVLTLAETIVDGETAITASHADGVDADTGFTVNMPEAFTTGTITLIDDASNGTVATAAAAMTMNNGVLATYTAAANGDKIDITPTKKSSATIASELSITAQEASALDNANTAAISGDSAGSTAMISVLNSGGTTAANAAEQVSVQADTMGADTAAAVAAAGQVLGAASTRLASLRSGAQYASTEETGFATGDGGLSKSAWFKPFGNLIRQGTRNNIKGYDADTYGVAAGIDREYRDGRLGVSFAYSDTDVDGKGTGKSQTDVESYQGMVYGDYTAKRYYVEGMIAYARNKSDTSRKLDFAGLNRTIIGDYSSNQYMAKVSAGAPRKMSGATYMTPTAGLSWTHVNSDSYTETGGGGFNQIVNPEDTDVIVGSVGVKIHTKAKFGNGFVVPELRGGLNYDFAGDEATASATFTGGGAAFNVTGAEVAQLGGNAGIGLTLINGPLSIAANYDAEIKDDYVGHSGTFEARIKF